MRYQECIFREANNKGSLDLLIEKNHANLSVHDQEKQMICLLRLTNFSTSSVEYRRLFVVAELSKLYPKIWPNIANISSYADLLVQRLDEINNNHNNKSNSSNGGVKFDSSGFVQLGEDLPGFIHLKTFDGEYPLCSLNERNHSLVFLATPGLNITGLLQVVNRTSRASSSSSSSTGGGGGDGGGTKTNKVYFRLESVTFVSAYNVSANDSYVFNHTFGLSHHSKLIRDW